MKACLQFSQAYPLQPLVTSNQSDGMQSSVTLSISVTHDPHHICYVMQEDQRIWESTTLFPLRAAPLSSLRNMSDLEGRYQDSIKKI